MQTFIQSVNTASVRQFVTHFPDYGRGVHFLRQARRPAGTRIASLQRAKLDGMRVA
jgi:hypothetical protein